MGWATLLAAVGGPIGLWYIISWLAYRRRKTNLKGKVVLITGANSGLGNACAKEFHTAGCHMILAGRNMEQLQEVQQQLQASSLPFSGKVATLYIDLCDLESIGQRVSEALDVFGRVDILVNNAGVSYRGCIQDTELDVHMKLMTVNYFGHVALTKALLPHMQIGGGGHIVMVSSLQGRFSLPYRSAYGASKHALQAFSDCLRAEVSDSNIRVCVFSPGYILTNLSRNSLCGDGSNYGAMDAATAMGLPAESVARDIVLAVQHNTAEVVPAQWLHKQVVWLRAILPNLYFWVMARRARKQRKDYIKCS